MNYKLISDSCCDLTLEQKKSGKYITVPLTIRVDDYCIQDDENFDRSDLIKRMSECSVGVTTACPSPDDFMKVYEADAEVLYVVTMSEHVSGTYQSAELAKKLYFEENPDSNKVIYVISSHSASAGQNRFLMKLEELCESGMSHEQVYENILSFRDKLKTYFVLESLENLRKNGRLGNIAAFLITKLNIKPIMSALDGKVVKLDQSRGMNKALAKMVEHAVKDAGIKIKEKIVVITEVNNIARGEYVAGLFKQFGDFKDIIVTKAAGVSTVYAENNGIVVGIG